MWVSQKGVSVVLSCRVQPNSSKQGIGEIKNDALIIRLNAPAVEGKANDALIRFLSKRLGIAKSRISIIQGERNRNKIVSLEGVSLEEIDRAFDGLIYKLDPAVAHVRQLPGDLRGIAAGYAEMVGVILAVHGHAGADDVPPLGLDDGYHLVK